MAALDGGRSIGEPPGERPLIIRVLYYHQVANEPESNGMVAARPSDVNYSDLLTQRARWVTFNAGDRGWE
jgi:hypothetical protein